MRNVGTNSTRKTTRVPNKPERPTKDRDGSKNDDKGKGRNK